MVYIIRKVLYLIINCINYLLSYYYLFKFITNNKIVIQFFKLTFYDLYLFQIFLI